MKQAIGFLLTTGEIAIIDEADAWLLRLRWKLLRRPDGLAYVARDDRRHIPGYTGVKLLHRAITGARRVEIVDHKNGDTLDNRRENLRIATSTQNNRNISPGRKNNTSGFLGVGWHVARGKWQASIRVGGKLQYLGLFDDVEAARAARREAELRLWGIEPRRAAELIP